MHISPHTEDEKPTLAGDLNAGKASRCTKSVASMIDLSYEELLSNTGASKVTGSSNARDEIIRMTPGSKDADSGRIRDLGDKCGPRVKRSSVDGKNFE